MKKRSFEIYLFRHGQTTFNRDKIFTGFIDSKLTERGRKQAIILSKKLKNKQFQIAVHTRLSRSKDTLKPILREHPECSLILEDNRMIERSYGDLEGESHESFKKRKGIKEFERIHRNFNARPPKGESFADVEKRVNSFILDLKKLVKKNKVNVAISAHGNSIRLFRKIMEKASKEEVEKWNIPYDKVFVYKIN